MFRLSPPPKSQSGSNPRKDSGTAMLSCPSLSATSTIEHGMLDQLMLDKMEGDGSPYTLARSPSTLTLAVSRTSTSSRSSNSTKDLKAVNSNVDPMPPMDGGYGWVVVAACFVLECLVDGQRSAFGIYQDYYTNEQFKGRASQSSISMIGTISNGGLGLMSVLGGLCADRFGYRPTILTGVVISSLGFFLASFSTKVWQLILTQGLMTAVGGMLIIAPALSVPSQWFLKRRGVASGMVSSGAGVGSVVYSMATRVLINKLGVDWTLRVVSLVFLLVGVACALLIRTRRQPLLLCGETSSKGTNMRQILSNPLVYLFMLVYMLCNAAFYVPPYFLPQYAKFNGLSSDLGAGLLSLFGGGSAIGRVVSGFMADYLGAMPLMLGVVTLAGIDALAVWPVAKAAAWMVIFGLTFGLFSGSFYPLAAITAANSFGTAHLATVNGMLCSAGGAGSLTGSPVAGLLLDKSQHLPNPYLLLSIFSGSTIMVASCCVASIMIYTRCIHRH
ncbi:hypothetical protein EV182_000838 [Spiromyces aspiralis]|uniref:Uncharacterized protein n=1 Tax=Spiromyces aspiralis TaxID=68401 RepID=A0ACC1HXR6_9FUNG|nr:hypothetical protein EV182_000838 [Spiromyces aspiralis]